MLLLRFIPIVLLAGSPWVTAGLAVQATAGELLYNGIRLPDEWPPDYGKLTREPVTPPYLTAPPEVIPIDVGRQLFVDDFLVAETTLTRTCHLAQYYPASPVLKADQPWESELWSDGEAEPVPVAMAFSDGVWFDPRDGLFKIWYMGGYSGTVCYATSTDGIHWKKPTLDVRPGTNVVVNRKRDGTTVCLDHAAQSPTERYKLFLMDRGKDKEYRCDIYFSADGIHWGEPVAQSRAIGEKTGERTSVFYNPFRKKWVYSLRCNYWFNDDMGRVRRYRECSDVIAGAQWTDAEAPWWTGADKDDAAWPGVSDKSQLYNLDAVAYESVMLGLFSVWPGKPSDRPKPNHVCVGFSRDGFHWSRPDHRPFIGISKRFGDWNWGNVQSVGGGCLVVGDELYFYVSGRAGKENSTSSGECATGLATLRRDGFVSMDAGATEGTLTTRPVRFSGKHLFVNADVNGGELRAEVVDGAGQPIPPFTRENCVPVRADGTRQAIRWKGAEDLSAVSGKPVALRFYLQNGQLYAFWVSPDESGISRGYVAAGGPGFTGPMDN
jgi:hypothetical protein